MTQPHAAQPQGDYYQLDERMSQPYGQNGGYQGGQPQYGQPQWGGQQPQQQYGGGYQQGGYQQGYPPPQQQPPPDQYQQPAYGAPPPPPQGEKYSFNEAFKIEKPKWNDIWAAILVSREGYRVQFPAQC
jgi:hypothetical protein